MMETVILETPRLRLVMWDTDDVGLVLHLHSTIGTTRYMSGAAPWTRERCEERLTRWFGEHARDGTTKYKVLSRDDGRFIGRAGISLYNRQKNEFELGYALREEEWGKGYATEIASALADWFFGKRFATHLIAFTHPENAVSQHILTKIGMRSRTPILIDGILCPTFELTANVG